MIDRKLPISLLCSMIALGGCDFVEQAGMEKSELLAMMSQEGPEIRGVEATMLNSAERAEESRQYGRALQFYRQLLDKDEENIAYIVGTADNLRRLQRHDEAIRYYERALSLEPDNLDALEGKGLLHISKADFKRASEAFETIMARDPQRWRSLNAVGILFIAKQMPQEAVAYFNEALRIQPGEPAVLNNLGLTLALQENYQGAVHALQRAGDRLEQNSTQKQRADLNLALVHGLSGDMQTAESVAAQHLSEAALNNNLGFYAYLADNRELAKGYLNHALSGSPVFYEKAWANLEAVKEHKQKSRTAVAGTPKATPPLRAFSPVVGQDNGVGVATTAVAPDTQTTLPERSLEKLAEAENESVIAKEEESIAADLERLKQLTPGQQPSVDHASDSADEVDKLNKAQAAPVFMVGTPELQNPEKDSTPPSQNHIFTDSEKSLLNAMDGFADNRTKAQERNITTLDAPGEGDPVTQEMFRQQDTSPSPEALAEKAPAAKGQKKEDDLEKLQNRDKGGLFDFMPDSIDAFLPNSPW